MPDNNNEKAKITYRTKAKAIAEANANITNTNIYALAIPTLFEYENAVSLHQEGKAYLVPYHDCKRAKIRGRRNIL